MKDSIFYTVVGVVAIATLGLFYSSISINTEKKFIVTSKDEMSETVSNPPSWPIVKDKNITATKKVAVSKKVENGYTDSNVSKNKNSNNTSSEKIASNSDDNSDADLPKEIAELKDEMQSIKNEAKELVAMADNLNVQMQEDDEKLQPLLQEADKITQELKDEGIVDVETIKQETDNMIKPIAIDEAPAEVKPSLIEADETTLKLEKALTKLKILDKGEE